MLERVGGLQCAGAQVLGQRGVTGREPARVGAADLSVAHRVPQQGRVVLAGGGVQLARPRGTVDQLGERVGALGGRPGRADLRRPLAGGARGGRGQGCRGGRGEAAGGVAQPGGLQSVALGGGRVGDRDHEPRSDGLRAGALVRGRVGQRVPGRLPQRVGAPGVQGSGVHVGHVGVEVGHALLVGGVGARRDRAPGVALGVVVGAGRFVGHARRVQVRVGAVVRVDAHAPVVGRPREEAAGVLVGQDPLPQRAGRVRVAERGDQVGVGGRGLGDRQVLELRVEGDELGVAREARRVVPRPVVALGDLVAEHRSPGGVAVRLGQQLGDQAGGEVDGFDLRPGEPPDVVRGPCLGSAFDGEADHGSGERDGGVGRGAGRCCGALVGAQGPGGEGESGGAGVGEPGAGVGLTEFGVAVDGAGRAQGRLPAGHGVGDEFAAHGGPFVGAEGAAAADRVEAERDGDAVLPVGGGDRRARVDDALVGIRLAVQVEVALRDDHQPAGARLGGTLLSGLGAAAQVRGLVGGLHLEVLAAGAVGAGAGEVDLVGGVAVVERVVLGVGGDHRAVDRLEGHLALAEGAARAVPVVLAVAGGGGAVGDVACVVAFVARPAAPAGGRRGAVLALGARRAGVARDRAVVLAPALHDLHEVGVEQGARERGRGAAGPGDGDRLAGQVGGLVDRELHVLELAAPGDRDGGAGAGRTVRGGRGLGGLGHAEAREGAGGGPGHQPQEQPAQARGPASCVPAHREPPSVNRSWPPRSPLRAAIARETTEGSRTSPSSSRAVISISVWVPVQP